MPSGVRSRGCAACQHRRIKCDGKTPSCGKCEKLGIECNGPDVGPIILLFNPQKKFQRKQRDASSIAPPPKEIAKSDGLPTPQFLMPYASYGIRAISNSPAIKNWFAHKLQETVYIPHQRDSSLVSELVKWSGSSEHPLLQRAVWAASAALNGVASNNPDLVKNAQEIYAGALKNLMRELSETAPQESTAPVMVAQQRSFGIQMVAAAAIFVWYEAIIGTSPYGWIAHALGAGKILLCRPPEDYRLGLSHKVFRTVRYMVANCSIMIIYYTQFGSPAWLDVPFSLTAKTGFDRVIDFMLTIPKSLAWVNEKLAAGLTYQHGVENARVREEVRMLEQRLKSFLLAYENERVGAGEEGLFVDVSPDRVDSTGEYHPKMRHYYSEEIAECVTHYEMCRLLMALIKAAFSNKSGFVVCQADALEHSASVLSCIPYAESKSTTKMAREHFGLVCVLITVLVASPSETHQNYAKCKIESWGGGNGLVGASPFHPIERWKALRAIWEKGAPPSGDSISSR